jgi:probable HAF family extracellular repeat protein
MRDLGTLGGPDASPSFINDAGQIAGTSYINFDLLPDPSICAYLPIATHPFFWERGKMTDIGTLGGTCAQTTTINNRGQVAGNSNLPGDWVVHPFLWERGKLTDLGTFGGTFGVANWMNDAGEVTGVASNTGDQEFHGFFWKNGVMTDIGAVGDDACSIPHFMNARGQVVGASGCTSAGFEVHGFLWQPGASIIDLNDFVPAGSDIQVTDGETINDSGVIAGSGLLPNGDFHAIVLVPCGDARADCIAAHPAPSSAMVAARRGAGSGAPSQANRQDVLRAALRHSNSLPGAWLYVSRPR